MTQKTLPALISSLILLGPALAGAKATFPDLKIADMALPGNTSSGGKVAAYECNDGVIDGGFTFKVLELSPELDEVVTFKKSKQGVEAIEDRHLDRTQKNSRFATYEFSNSDDGLKMQISPILERDTGKRHAIFTSTTKVGTTVIYTTCFRF